MNLPDDDPIEQTEPLTESVVWRVLDANANRAAEGLRTIEDVARLVREDNVAAQWTKALRHDLAAAVSQLDRSQRLAARSTATDAGTFNTAQAERGREDWQAIVSAACERVGQSLRCLEEFSKLIDASVGAAFKMLRYRAYDTLAQLELRLARESIAQSAQVYLLVDCSQPLAVFAASLRKYAAAGVDLFQLRDKAGEGKQLVTYARAGVEALLKTSSKLIVNDRVDVALASGAAGVHLGQEDLDIRDARRIGGSRLWIGVSTHSLQQALEAERAGADYIGCGPTFPSQTKAFSEFPGTQFLAEVAKSIAIPYFAIGGVEESRLDELLAVGCRRIALSSGIHRSSDPCATVREIKRRMGAAL